MIVFESIAIVYRVMGRRDGEFVRHGRYCDGDTSVLDEFPNVYPTVSSSLKVNIVEVSQAKRFAACPLPFNPSD